MNKLKIFWCQKVLPLVYDESLSYYEFLCKLTHKINEVIEDNTNIRKIIDSIATSLNKLWDKVNNINITPVFGSAYLETDSVTGDIDIDIWSTKYGNVTDISFNPTDVYCLPTNDDYTNPISLMASPLQFTMTHNYDITINAGNRGTYIFNGTPYVGPTRSGWYYLAFKGLEYSFVPRLTEELPVDYLLEHYDNVIPSFSPLIVNGEKFDYTVLPKTDPNYEYIVNGNHNRQVFMVDNNDKWHTLIFDGRSRYNIGWTYDNLIEILLKMNAKNAFNLDGGGSCTSLVNNIPVNFTPSTSPQGRPVVSVLCFNVKRS